MLGNCVSSHLGQFGAMTGDSRCGQPGLRCVSDLRGPKSPQDNRAVSGVITYLAQVRLKQDSGEESRYKTSLKILRLMAPNFRTLHEWTEQSLGSLLPPPRSLSLPPPAGDPAWACAPTDWVHYGSLFHSF